MHYFPGFYGPDYVPFGFIGAVLPLLLAVVLWTIILKGYALWHAARNGQKWWFIALLVVNTLGILEIIYLIWFRPTTSATIHHTHTAHTPEPDSSAKA